MIGIGNLPPGVSATAFDEPVSDYSRHMEALDKAEESIPCPSCQRKGIVECERCYGTALIPATREQFEAFEMGDAARDLREFGLGRLAKIPQALYIHARLYQIIRELEMRSAA